MRWTYAIKQDYRSWLKQNGIVPGTRRIVELSSGDGAVSAFSGSKAYDPRKEFLAFVFRFVSGHDFSRAAQS
jgi:hypothetical protein